MGSARGVRPRVLEAATPHARGCNPIEQPYVFEAASLCPGRSPVHPGRYPLAAPREQVRAGCAVRRGTIASLCSKTAR